MAEFADNVIPGPWAASRAAGQAAAQAEAMPRSAPQPENGFGAFSRPLRPWWQDRAINWLDSIRSSRREETGTLHRQRLLAFNTLQKQLKAAEALEQSISKRGIKAPSSMCKATEACLRNISSAAGTLNGDAGLAGPPKGMPGPETLEGLQRMATANTATPEASGPSLLLNILKEARPFRDEMSRALKDQGIRRRLESLARREEVQENVKTANRKSGRMAGQMMMGNLGGFVAGSSHSSDAEAASAMGSQLFALMGGAWQILLAAPGGQILTRAGLWHLTRGSGRLLSKAFAHTGGQAWRNAVDISRKTREATLPAEEKAKPLLQGITPEVATAFGRAARGLPESSRLRIPLPEGTHWRDVAGIGAIAWTAQKTGLGQGDPGQSISALAETRGGTEKIMQVCSAVLGDRAKEIDDPLRALEETTTELNRIAAVERTHMSLMVASDNAQLVQRRLNRKLDALPDAQRVSLQGIAGLGAHLEQVGPKDPPSKVSEMIEAAMERLPEQMRLDIAQMAPEKDMGTRRVAPDQPQEMTLARPSRESGVPDLSKPQEANWSEWTGEKLYNFAVRQAKIHNVVPTKDRAFAERQPEIGEAAPARAPGSRPSSKERE